ncbi:N-carbamoylputrescine amidase [Deinococcus psychrotolerans]|uniref:N-carbamoylputrescine amidase n=1 Tax=Deinococcus psychrotolerans TaxID=2489213 RepID=A0A3G8YNT9_9DEIO|nr:N-carbamoylputrescine amidase [Deinococcus psychrotolerans]AZI43261.1 N-carbamoylputrescine amidase [Deinococcus psychrotolerans]
MSIPAAPTPSTVNLAVIQMHVTDQLADNLTRAEQHVRDAAGAGANVILLPELFESLYFCQVEREDYFALARPVEGHPFLGRFQNLAAALGVVLPISFFEAAGQTHYNSLACIDADGKMLGVYRKAHIPDGPGYEEKYYFTPGDTGFKVWPTRYGRIGAGICWDQWYPESARAMLLLGADFLLYPTAIGSEPEGVESPNSHAMWQRAMQGHAVSNSSYVGAANRIGAEVVAGLTQTYYGHSFISDYTGELVAEFGSAEEGALIHPMNLQEARKFRAGMGFFRDRRPELYGPLLTMDGVTRRG